MVRGRKTAKNQTIAHSIANIKSDEGEDKRKDRPLEGKRSHDDGGSEGPSTKVARCSGFQERDWDEKIHAKFVEAIFEIGLNNSSPAVILENMMKKPESITSERVKSKLQKYRKNREKSKQEFLNDYDNFLQKAKAIDCARATPRNPSAAASLLEMMGTKQLLGGDAAAFLSYAVMKEQDVNFSADGNGSTLSTQMLQKGAMEYVENFAGTGIPFPELSDDEKGSPLGLSMQYIMGLFLSMTQHLKNERSVIEGVNASDPSVVTPNHLPLHGNHQSKEGFSEADIAPRGSLSADEAGYAV